MEDYDYPEAEVWKYFCDADKEDLPILLRFDILTFY